MDLDSTPYAHWMYAWTREGIEALAEHMKGLGYEIADHDWPWPGQTPQEMPLLSNHCIDTGCAGCKMHWLLVVNGPYGDEGLIKEECAKLGAFYDGGEFTMKGNLADAKAVFAHLAEGEAR